MLIQTLTEGFSQTCINNQEKIAISFLRKTQMETEISYRELNQDSNQIANEFLELGVNKGDRVLLLIEKCLFLAVAHIALQKIGAIGVPLNPGFKEAELSYLLEDAQATMAIVGPSQQAIIERIDSKIRVIPVDPHLPYQTVDFFRRASDRNPQVDVLAEDPALIIYTSGTTGKPKGAVLTQANLLNDARNIVEIWEITESDVICHVLPLFHVHGLCFALHTALIAGSRILMLDAFLPKAVLRILSGGLNSLQCTVFMAVPSMYSKLLDSIGEQSLDFGNLRLLTSGSAPLLVQDFHRIANIFGREPVEREGMTETGMNFSNPLSGKRKPGSIGIPLPGLAVRIVDNQSGQDVIPGQIGEIWLKGPSISPGYWRKPEETDQAFVNDWFRTGDLGKIDQDGYYYLTDRLKNLIISGGENISPKEVEVVINQFEGILESSVIAIPDEQWGEKVVAAVVTRSGIRVEPNDLKIHCKKFLHDWKCPKHFAIVESLPRNTMGKILKDDVKKLFLDA
jgi:malonyl-CoA/methylmalonyl-CoA synthetase